MLRIKCNHDHNAADYFLTYLTYFFLKFVSERLANADCEVKVNWFYVNSAITGEQSEPCNAIWMYVS